MITRIVEYDGDANDEAFVLTLEAAFWEALDEVAMALGRSSGQVVSNAAWAARRENAPVEDVLRVILIRYFQTNPNAARSRGFERVTPPRPRPRDPRRLAGLSGRA